MKRGRAFALAVVGLLAACCTASGDGKFFSAADDVRVPNQKALLWLENGRETLILQVKYEGGAAGFSTAFAGRLNEATPSAVPTLGSFVRAGRGYLVALRSKMLAAEIKRDVMLARANADESFHTGAPGRATGPRGVGRGLGPRDGKPGRVAPRDQEELRDAALTEPEFLLLGILAGLAVILVGRGLLRRAARRRGS